MEKHRSAEAYNDDNVSPPPSDEDLPTASQSPSLDASSTRFDNKSAENGATATSGEAGDRNTIFGISNCQITNITINPVESKPESLKPSTDKDTQINEIVSMIQKSQISTFQLDLFDTREESIPVVHPRIVNVLENDDFLKEDTYKPILGDEKSFYEKKDVFKYGKETSFEQLLERVETNSFITLSGFAGSGKTTLVKRLAEAFCNKTNGLCFYLEFCHINYPQSYTLNLKQLLLDNAYPDFTEQDYKETFDWVLKNQERCLIILDGYDKAEWSLNEVGTPTNQNWKNPQTIGTLVANLCRNHFLKKTCVIVTSRPHKVTSIPSALQPGLSLMISDFSFESAAKLFFALAKNDAENLWKNLTERASQVVRYCLNPLILQLYIRTCTILKNNINEISTLTEIYTTVLLEMKENTRHRNMDKIIDQLSSLAFTAIKNCKLAIAIDEQTKTQLDIDDVPSFIKAIGICIYRPKTFEEDKYLYFLHQSLLEYFAAHYIAHKMELSDYAEFIETYLFTDQWAMVRRFLCGILIDNKDFPKSSLSSLKYDTKTSSREELLVEKRSKLQDLLCTHFKNAARRKLVMLCNDVWECDNAELTRRVVATFPKQVKFFNTLLSTNDAHAIGYLMRKVDQNLQEIVLENSILNSLSFKHLYKAIKEMRGLIGRLDIRYNRLSAEDNDKICDILHKITDVLLMRECFADGESRRNANQEERRKLQKCLNQLPNSKLVIVLTMEDDKPVNLFRGV